jgi:hypothetical protein
MGRTVPPSESASQKERLRDSVVRLIKAAHARRHGAEAREIAKLVEHKVADNVKEADEAATEEVERRTSFVRLRFGGRLAQYEKNGRWYSRLDNVLNLASIAAGAAAALAGGLHTRPWVLIVLGSVVAVLQTFSQWVKPSQRATCRSHAAARLRDEGWDFVLGQNRYKSKDLCAAWPIFYAGVNRVAQRQEAVEDHEAAAAAPGSAKA